MSNFLQFLKERRRPGPLPEHDPVPDPSTPEDKRRVEAIFAWMCTHIPDLLVLREGDIFYWDLEPRRTVDLTRFRDVRFLDSDAEIEFPYFRLYREQHVTDLPVNLLFVALYDKLVEYHFPVLPRTYRYICLTLQRYFCEQTRMDTDILQIYLDWFNPHRQVGPDKMDSVRELGLRHISHCLLSHKPSLTR